MINHERLRAMKLDQLLEQLAKTVSMAKYCDCSYPLEHRPEVGNPVPLLAIGDFDIFPRDEISEFCRGVLEMYHKEAAQNAAMRAALLASRKVLEDSRCKNLAHPSSEEWFLDRDRAYMAIQVALGEVGSVAPMARTKAETPSPHPGYPPQSWEGRKPRPH